MLKLLLSPQAINDLEDVFEYTVQNWSVTQAENYQNLLFESMNTMLRSPKIGTKYYFIKGEYRKLNSSKHIIFYRIEEATCIVVRILHERMDLNSHFI